VIKRIDFRSGKDLKCAILGHAGLHTSAIERLTGLSPGQVGYRLKIAAIKRKDYRNGESAMSKLIVRQLDERGNVTKSTQTLRQTQDMLQTEEKRLRKLTLDRLKKRRGKKH